MKTITGIIKAICILLKDFIGAFPKLALFLVIYYICKVMPQQERARHQANMAAYEERKTDMTEFTANDIPEYAGEDTIILNNDCPFFTNEWTEGSTHVIHLSELDSLGRAGGAIIQLQKADLPKGKKPSEGSYTPSGWNQKEYADIIDYDPPNLMVQKPLLLWSISGITKDPRNLIAVTRHCALEMYKTEVEVADELRAQTGLILYRVTPLYKGNELLARGVLLEAYNQERTWSICRFIYNVQPGIEINYVDGSNSRKEAL